MPQSRDLGSAIENRRGEAERIMNGQAQSYKVFGHVEVTDPGEAIVNIPFPVFFVDIPAYAFGSHLGPGQPSLTGSLPTCSTSVLRWDERVRDDGSFVYAGVTLGIVSTGPPGQVIVVQWQMEGTGLRGPVPNE